MSAVQATLNSGERELHFFSMDNRFKQGLLSYERRWHPAATQRGDCDAAREPQQQREQPPQAARPRRPAVRWSSEA